jgi:hypothetical protein
MFIYRLIWMDKKQFVQQKGIQSGQDGVACLRPVVQFQVQFHNYTSPHNVYTHIVIDVTSFKYWQLSACNKALRP